MKVKDLATKFGKKPKDFIKVLLEFDIKVKSENTKLDSDTITLIEDLFKGDSDYLDEKIKDSKKIKFSEKEIKISDLAKLIDSPLKDIMGVILKKGLLLNLNTVIDANLAKDIATDLEIQLILNDEEDVAPSTNIKEKIDKIKDSFEAKNLKSRPPVITVMGHVDHGKTLLLDKIRSANVADSESGGITQHIGAYQVKLESKKKMTFLDTPGHEAFTALRSRGAQITDIAILVIAADDGIKPQTIEAINHAKAAETPIIVAINKIDTPGADIEKVKQQIMEHDLVPEEWGGSTVICPVSAKTGDGITNLLEMISLTAEVQELKASYEGLSQAVAIESFLDKKRGPITTVLIQSGKLAVGSFVTIGHVYGKIRALNNDKGETVKEALPSTPVELLGLTEVPNPGDMLKEFSNEQEAKSYAEAQLEQIKSQKMRSTNSVSLNTLSDQINEGDVKKLNIILKADVHGSLDALILSISQIENKDISINIIHSATGSITENDILLAKAAENAIIIGFRVSSTNETKSAAEDSNITIKVYDIIYEILEDLQNVMSGMYNKVLVETKIGEAEVREVFKFSKVGAIAGSYVTEGKLIRNSVVKVLREGEELFKGNLSSLKRFKDDVRQVETKYECGIVINGYSEFESGDIIECYSVNEE